ncbi:hypothetical protein KIW84_076600 [Lathyrus oleraceus]|uniref:DUF7745 domain-containing protein n=1 Tax=Pisum sativum TaxID=3888 RepID=A0A9D4VYN5_PEA|nr:hypothetical protein KIW84_076600 [Pisum sativum]
MRRPGLKDDVVYSFFDPEISVLKDMITLITPDHVGMFREMYGGILKMVFRLTDRDRSAIHTLLQFYDPGLRCFVFPDYLLGPLMEDYADILGIQIRNQVPFYATKEEPDIGGISRALYLSPEMVKESLKEKGKLPGFHLSFLEAKAKEQGFVDINAIRLFVQRNPIPTLIGDVYYSVHNRNEKRRGGLIRCCTQLLYKWFMGYLPTRGAFVLLGQNVNWATKLMGLRAKDIAWTHSSGVGQDFICSCGGFPNVPLIGVQGCINYNPTLLKRQMGFAMELPPFKSEVQETLYFPVEGNQAKVRQVSDAWRSIQRKGKFSWGRANNRSFPPFDDWLSKRVELTCLPFLMVDPWYPLIEESPSFVGMEEFLEMKRERDQLLAEKTELEMSVARVQMANQEIRVRMEDQDKRHALEAKRFEMDTAYYGKVNQALASSTKEHDITKERLARASKVIEDQKRRQILVRDQRDDKVRVLVAEWEAKLKLKESENLKVIAERDHCIAERDHYIAERDHYFRQMKIHQKEVGRLQQENTELRFAAEFAKMVDEIGPSVGPSSG